MYLGPGTGFMPVGGAAAQGLARSAAKEHAGDAASVAEVKIIYTVLVALFLKTFWA